jgi:Domain of unknown function (DUF4349)
MRTLFFLSLILMLSCQQRSKTGYREEEIKATSSSSLMLDTSNKPEDGSTSPSIDRKLIKNGSLTFKVSDMAETKKQIDKLVKETNGYPSNEIQSNYDERLQSSVTVRIPAHKFDDFINTILKLATKVDSKNITTEDVTEEFIDTEARIKTKKELEIRYREILKQAKTVDEILSIESNLANVRTEIESAEGKLNYLKSQVSMSTINITYYQAIGTDFGFASKLVMSFKNGWENLLVFLIGLISIWPFVIGIAGLAFWFYKKRLKKKSIQINP